MMSGAAGAGSAPWANRLSSDVTSGNTAGISDALTKFRRSMDLASLRLGSIILCVRMDYFRGSLFWPPVASQVYQVFDRSSFMRGPHLSLRAFTSELASRLWRDLGFGEQGLQPLATGGSEAGSAEVKLAE